MDMPEFLAKLDAAARKNEAAQRNGERKISLQPEAALMRLREAAQRFLEADKGPRFKVGDVITPSADATLKGAGEPHVVVALGSSEYQCKDEPVGSCTSGCRRDIRVLCFAGVGDSIAAFWVESAEFTPWAPQ